MSSGHEPRSSLGALVAVMLALAAVALLVVGGGIGAMAFMYYQRSQAEDRELDVALVAASEARPLTAMEDVFINIDRDGNFVIDRQVMTDAEVEAYLREKLVEHPGSLAVKIRPDSNGGAQRVINAFNICAKAGVRDAAIVTQGED